MCTAITFESKDFYFGRTLDLSYHYNETVTVTPRKLPLCFRNGEKMSNHYAMIGMATVAQDYPLYYEATNEKGLSAAGLNFPDNAVYYPENKAKQNVAPFELIPYILGKCATADEAYDELVGVNICDLPFSKDFPSTPLHWIVADKKRCIVIEQTENGLRIYENPVGTLTNNPPFEYHLHNHANYVNLTPDQPETKTKPYSLGMGAIGLPGDWSSASRFVRVNFAKQYAFKGENESETVNQFFRILGCVEQIKGLNRISDGSSHYSVYTSCCNTDRGIYYYKVYDSAQIVCVDMKKEDLKSDKLIKYSLINYKSFLKQN